MKQREIWLADLNPVKGSEQRGVRPVVILSGNSMNANLDICIVCPLSLDNPERKLRTVTRKLM